MYKTWARQVTALVTKVYDLNIWSVHAIGYVEIGATKLAVGSCYWTEVDAYLPIITQPQGRVYT